jgi:integral membrane sensor domain MASE1
MGPAPLSRLLEVWLLKQVTLVVEVDSWIMVVMMTVMMMMMTDKDDGDFGSQMKKQGHCCCYLPLHTISVITRQIQHAGTLADRGRR